MIDAGGLMAELIAGGVTTVTGVPCSYLTPVINRAISDPRVRYLAATHEGEAAAIAAGAWLGGGLGCAIGQNSGLGNMVNPLTSLSYPAQIPLLAMVTWRGEPGRPDEPQHELMGRITGSLLDLMEIPWGLLPAAPAELPRALHSAWQFLRDKQLPYAVVLPAGRVMDEPLHEAAPTAREPRLVSYPDAPAPTRWAALESLVTELPDDAAVVSTTGKTSRELYTIADRPQHFYLVGAMGSAVSVGLGVALHTPRPVVVIDGDGALLMRMGSLATTATHGPENLVHIVLDNGVHDSTGGQRTLSAAVDVAAVAAACGYAQVHRCHGLADLTEALHSALNGPGPSFIHLPIEPGSHSPLGRPRVTPSEVARRFRAFVGEPVG
ncbi:phosphonopyruvate decarboxylase [Actinoplanes sp. NPDC048967]|uniref:phosphonopyruvate decarboxylase n=1 Tax=Actinoplanes sp. NPDC048967 TaxID=3155269 RepID=UPI0033DAD354